MKRGNLRRSGQAPVYRVALLLAVLVAAVGGLKFIELSRAATPASGAIAPSGPVPTFTGSWTGDRTGQPPAANGEPTCTTSDEAATNCDNFTLTVNGTPADWVGLRIRVRFNWLEPGNDFDMVVRKESNGVAGLQGDSVTPPPTLDDTIGTSGRGTSTEEEVVISPSDTGTGVYYVRSIYFATPVIADQYQGSVAVFTTSTTLPASSCTAPTLDNYQPPVGHTRRDSSGEPSIGVNWNSGNVLAMSRLTGQRATFNDSTSPANPTTGVTWFAKPIPLNPTGFDPILFTDSVTGRTIAGELEVVGGSMAAVITDDDFGTISNAVQTGGPTQGVDHQTVGGGPPNPSIAGRQPTTSYPHLFYYASQQIAFASVATSFDGGFTYQPAVPAYTLAQCGGLHGHIKVAPDGTVYLPNKGCGGKSGFAVSENNGLSWSVRTIPTSTAGRTDPSIGIGTGGRVFFAYAGADNHPRVAVSDDRGLTWRDDFDLGVGVTPNLTASVFPHAVAGDNNRAAVFFLGTSSTNPGNPVGDDAGTVFAGTWYPYIATTCDGGRSWSVVRADNDPLNPGVSNPAQQGVVCTNGTTCPAGTRNLLDFNDLTVDSRGRIVAVYADGCNFDHPCIGQPDNDPVLTTKAQNQGIARLTILRQRGGMRLFGAFEPGGPAPPPLAPPISVQSSPRGSNIRWATPDDGGSPLLSYRIYRGIAGQRAKRIAEVKANTHSYRDRDVKRGTRIYYRVTAVNAYGESPRGL